MKSLNIAVLATGLIWSAVPAAQADTATQKFVRGVAGMTAGILELPGNIVRQTREKGLAGIPIGLFEGLSMSVTRELVGAYEFVTAPLPVPTHYQPILSPEYPWSYFVGSVHPTEPVR